MPRIVLRAGAFTLKVAYLWKRPDGVYFYRRRKPAHVLKVHPTPALIRESLKTRSLEVALKRLPEVNKGYETLWASLGTSVTTKSAAGDVPKSTRAAAVALLKTLDIKPGEAKEPEWDPDKFDLYFARRYGQRYLDVRHDPESGIEPESLLNPVEREAVEIATTPRGPHSRPPVYFSDALGKYLELRGHEKTSKAYRDVQRDVGLAIQVLGDLPLASYNRASARTLVEAYSKLGVRTTTVRRKLNHVSAVFAKALIEFDLQSVNNPFLRLDIAREALDSEDREPFTERQLKLIARECQRLDDEIRYIPAMMLDTGARIAEIVGLRVQDVDLLAEVPVIHIRPDEASGRTLKTENSERTVPLVGLALWAAERAVAAAKSHRNGGGWLFPRYARTGRPNANSASAAINKWLRSLPEVTQTSHSFRHSMNDRLREADVDEERRNVICGWANQSIGSRYGAGHRLKQLQEDLEKVVFPLVEDGSIRLASQTSSRR